MLLRCACHLSTHELSDGRSVLRTATRVATRIPRREFAVDLLNDNVFQERRGALGGVSASEFRGHETLDRPTSGGIMSDKPPREFAQRIRAADVVCEVGIWTRFEQG